MAAFAALLRTNRNYRYSWTGQVISEIGDHFNNIAVFSLAFQLTGSGAVVSGVLLARGFAVLGAGPLAGVALDRFDRKRLMLASDLFRALVALAFLLCLVDSRVWLLYLLSATLMFASPFFTSGRAAILPTIASRAELHTAASLTQTTQWTTLAIGALLGGASVTSFGYNWAFVVNALSFLGSAACIWRLRSPHGFRAPVSVPAEESHVRPWQDYLDGLRYMRGVPLVFGLALLSVGWATGGGAAQVLFTLFGEKVFSRGAAGIGTIWGSAAIGLIIGGIVAHRAGGRLSFSAYKWTIAGCYLVHGGAYVLFSISPSYRLALVFIALSRAAVGVSSVLNMSRLLRHVEDSYRGRVFSTIESMTWAMMMLSMTAAGFASTFLSIRAVGVCSGILSSTTAVWWVWANLAGKLPEPPATAASHSEAHA